MALTLYTTPDEIRGVLGLTVRELPDSVLNLNQHETQLVMDFEQMSDTLAADYLSTAAKLPASRTAVEQKLVDLTQLFSAYSVSKNLISSLALFSPQKITDGKAGVERFVDSYAQIKLGIRANYANIRAKLKVAYANFGGIVKVEDARSYMLVSIGADPVTAA